MSEETESDLSDAIARHSALVHSMMENTPLELAHMATGSGSKKIQLLAKGFSFHNRHLGRFGGRGILHRPT